MIGAGRYSSVVGCLLRLGEGPCSTTSVTKREGQRRRKRRAGGREGRGETEGGLRGGKEGGEGGRRGEGVSMACPLWLSTTQLVLC